MVVGILLVFECQSTVAHVVKILKPLEVGDGDTTSVDVQVRDDEDFLGLEDLICFRSSRTVGTLSNDLNTKFRIIFTNSWKIVLLNS